MILPIQDLRSQYGAQRRGVVHDLTPYRYSPFIAPRTESLVVDRLGHHLDLRGQGASPLQTTRLVVDHDALAAQVELVS